MQIEVKTDEDAKEPRIVIYCDRMTDEVRKIVEKLSEDEPHVISGVRNGTVEIIDEADIISAAASAGRVTVRTVSGEYDVRLRLYELESRLDGKRFVRISNSEIINLKRARNFDLSFTGTICVSMSDGSTAYVSRRYVSKIKRVLGI